MLEVVVLSQSDSILATVVETLRVQALLPDRLVWSTIPGTCQGRLWLSLEANHTQVDALTACFLSQPSIRRVLHENLLGHGLQSPSERPDVPVSSS